VRDDRFTGWIGADDLDRVSALDDLEPVPPLALVSPESTLREALEIILTSHSAAAVMQTDDGRFAGLVELDAIRRGLAG
jgi:CBS domain-containing protein